MRDAKRFYPDYMVEILAVSFIIAEAVLVLAFLFPPAVGRPIDFSAQFQPKPEWYFLWLYEIVRYFPGRFAVIGTVLVPLSAFALFLLIPWIDRGRRGRARALLVGISLLLGLIVFTLIPAFGR